MIGLQSTGTTEGSLGCCVKERHVELPNKVLWSAAAVLAEGSQELCWGQPAWAEGWWWCLTRDGPSSCQSIWAESWHRWSSPWKTQPYRGAWGFFLGLDGRWAHCLQELWAGGGPFFSPREELWEQICRLWSGRDDRKKLFRSSPKLCRYKSLNIQLYWRWHRNSLSWKMETDTGLSGWETETLTMTDAGSFCFEPHDLGLKQTEEMGCQSIGSHSGEVISLSAVVRNICMLCLSPDSPVQQRHDKLEWVPHRPMMLIKGEWGICPVLWDWEAELVSLEKGMFMGEVLPKYLMGE